MGMHSEHKHCRVCGRLYEIGSRGTCRACQRVKGSSARRGAGKAKGQAGPIPRKRRKILRCDCGKPAVTVLPVRVGENGVYQARLPLCADCLKLEQSYGMVGPAMDSGDTTKL